MDFLSELNQTLEYFLVESTKIINERNSPKHDSPALRQLQNEKYMDYVASANSVAILLREIAADNLVGIQRAFINPILTYAPFVLFRGIVEVSALSTWLSSYQIDEFERTRRYFIYRADSLAEQVKFCQSINNESSVKEIRTNIDKLIHTSEELKLEIVRIYKGEKKIIKKPSTTELVRDIFHSEDTYRLFSAIAHGQHWAVLSLSFSTKKSGVEIYPSKKGGEITKDISLLSIIYLFTYSVNFFCRCVIEQSLFFGYDENPLVSLQNQVVRRINDIKINYSDWRTI